MILAIKNISTGLSRITINTDIVSEELKKNNIVLMEFIQLKLRSLGIKNAYDLCKEFSRGKTNYDNDELLAFLREKNVTTGDNQHEIENEITKAFEMDIDF